MSSFKGLTLDNRTIRQAQQGNAASLTIIFERFAPAVYTLAMRMCQSRAVADDLTQDTFMTVMKSLPQFRFEASFATWVRRIAVTRCLMHLRSAWEQRAESFPDESLLATDAPISGFGTDTGIDVGEALAKLPVISRTVVWLHDVEGYSHQEIADMSGKTVSFSKSALSRARQQLRAMLAAETPQQKRTVDTPDTRECLV